MKSCCCRDLEQLLTPYIDGEVTPEQCAAIEAHLASCPACRRCADAEAGGRAVVRRCRDHLKESAPPSLHAKCRTLAQSPEVHAPAAGAGAPPMTGPFAGTADADRAAGPLASVRGRGWRWWAPVSVAASLVLAVAGVVLFGLLSDRGTALAAQLAGDHISCTRLIGGGAPADRAESAERWQQTRGWPVGLPASSPADDIEFVALRRCFHTGGETAHAMYRHHGRLVSLFIFPDGTQPHVNLEIMGQRAAIWSHRDRSYAVVAKGSAAEVERLVAFFTRATE